MKCRYKIKEATDSVESIANKNCSSSESAIVRISKDINRFLEMYLSGVKMSDIAEKYNVSENWLRSELISVLCNLGIISEEHVQARRDVMRDVTAFKTSERHNTQCYEYAKKFVSDPLKAEFRMMFITKSDVLNMLGSRTAEDYEIFKSYVISMLNLKSDYFYEKLVCAVFGISSIEEWHNMFPSFPLSDENISKINSIMNRLSTREKAIISLYHRDGKTEDEIGIIYGVSHTAIHNARNAIYQVLRRNGIEECIKGTDMQDSIEETSISTLNLTTRIYNALVKLGASTVRDILVLFKSEYIYAIRNIGYTSYCDLILKLEELGLTVPNVSTDYSTYSSKKNMYYKLIGQTNLLVLAYDFVNNI